MLNQHIRCNCKMTFVAGLKWQPQKSCALLGSTLQPVCVCVCRGCGWLRLWAFQGLCLANRVVERRLTNCAAGSMRLHQLRAVRTSSGASIQKFCKILSHTQKCWLANGGGGTVAAAARGRQTQALSPRHLHMQPQATPLPANAKLNVE